MHIAYGMFDHVIWNLDHEFLKAFDVPRYCVNRVEVLSKLKALCVEITIFHFPSQYLQLCDRDSRDQIAIMLRY